MKLIAITSILFSVLVIFQLFTGIYMFFIRYGINPSEATFSKSLQSIVEVSFPHFIAISATVFVILHLFYFFKLEKKHFLLAGILFTSGIMDIISSFFMLLSKKFYFIKVISFFIFETSFFLACVWLIILFRKRIT